MIEENSVIGKQQEEASQLLENLFISLNKRDQAQTIIILDEAINSPITNFQTGLSIKEIEMQLQFPITELLEYIKVKHQKKKLNDFIKFFEKALQQFDISNDLEFWQPLIIQIVKKLKFMAVEAESEIKKFSENPLGLAGMKIRDLLTQCNLKKLDMMSSKLINEVFWVYFKMLNFQQSKGLIETMGEKMRTKLKDFSQSDFVCQNYYEGRMYMFQADFQNADKWLSQSFSQALFYPGKNSLKINRQILKQLIIAKMLCGVFPANELLEKFNLNEQKQLAVAAMKGDMDEQQKSVNENKRILMRRGIQLQIERIKMILLRNLFKKIFLLVNEKEKKQTMSLETGPKKQNKVQIDTENFRKVLCANAFNKKQELDEVECLFANLISNGYVKGYISHEKRKIVFSQSNPFPSIIKK